LAGSASWRFREADVDEIQQIEQGGRGAVEKNQKTNHRDTENTESDFFGFGTRRETVRTLLVAEPQNLPSL